MFLIIAFEEFACPAKFRRLQVHIIHELINQGNGNLLNLCLRVWHFADQDIPQGIDFPFNIKVQHNRPSHKSRKIDIIVYIYNDSPHVLHAKPL